MPYRHTARVAACLCLPALLAGGAGAAPGVTTAEGRAPHATPSAQELRSADAAFTKEITLPDGATGVAVWLRCGPSGIAVSRETRAGSKNRLTLRPFSASLPARAGAEPTPLPDAGIEVAELRLRRYVRPNPATLKPDARDRLVREWQNRPSPLGHVLPLAFVQDAGDVECTLDGLYAGKVIRAGNLRAVRFTVPPGSALGPASFAVAQPAEFVPLDITRQDRPGTLAGAQATLAGPLGRVPFVPPAAANLDLGATAAHADLYANYTYRGAFDGLRESFLFTVPHAQYIRAWVLCAVESSPAKDPALTARLTRFVSQGPYSGRARDSLADTTVVLPRTGQAPAEGITQVGTITAKDQQLPLYLVEVPLMCGDIQDILFYEQGDKQRGTLPIGPYLDFELLGRLRPQDRPHPFGDGRDLPDGRRVSGVHVFAVTLEKTPVEMEVRQTQPGNIFHNQETPELVVALRPQADGRYLLRWSMRDVDGKSAGGGEKALSLKAADGEQTIPISLRQPRLGWYGIDFEMWQGDRKLLGHRASFALLGPDTRLAGYESPYASWWFFYHYGTRDPKVIGPLMLKAGFRKAGNGVDCCSEAELAPWRFTAPAIGWGRLADTKATDAQIETHIREHLARYPRCQTLMIFHESMPGAPLGTRTAPELFAMPVQEYPGADERWQHATRIARIARTKFPELKIYIGNSGANSEMIAEGMRRKFPPEYADYIGVETVGRTGHPEKLWEGGLQGVWFLREIARKHGYPWKVTSCFEANYRQDRLLGDDRLAEWYVRDTLLSHAYRFPYISIGLLHDTGNSYHGSFWGATGLCRRFPLLYPKKAYVAMAAITRVLDRVTLRREVPTGSNSVYALEFSRADGKNVTAVWTARGTCALSLSFRGTSALEVVDLYGRGRSAPAPQGKVSLTAGTAAQYLVTAGTLTGVRCGRRTCPEDQPPAGVRVVNAMDKADEWQISTAQDPLLEQVSRPHLPFRTAGNFAVRGVKDAEKGPCLEVELLSGKEPSTPLLSEYAVLRLKKPIPLAGEPTTLGLWVKGNSGWGEVYWEIEDAAGVRRVSCGTPVHDADVFDYDGRVSLNYDGWAFLHFPITEKSPIPDLSTGSVSNLWEATDRNKPVTYPIRVTGVAFSARRQALHLTEMHPVKQVMRFRDLGVYD